MNGMRHKQPAPQFSGPAYVSKRLTQNHDRIMAEWAARARAASNAARQQETLVLYNHIPQFLTQMALALAQQIPADGICAKSDVCREHGEQRAGLPEYSLKEMINEYEVLRRVLFEVLEEERPLLPRERDCILTALHQGVSVAAAEYARIQDSIREQFIAILAHDLRNPLSAAKTSAQMIQRRPTQVEAVEKFSGRIVASLKRVDTMIRDLLDTFQVRAGKPLPIQIESNDLASVAKEALDELITVHGARFVLHSPKSLPGFFCGDGVRRSIENLANNAVKYGSPDQPITIRLEQKGDAVEVAVHNLGNPLIADEQAKLFRPFHRAPFAEASGKKGWGLGLTLVQGVAKSHGGRVIVDSSLERGTTFTLHLPQDARPFYSSA